MSYDENNYDEKGGSDDERDYGMDRDNDDYDVKGDGDDDKFENEMGAYDRAGFGGVLAEKLQAATLQNLNNKNSKQKINPDDRFLIFVDSISRKINETTPITQEDIDTMIRKTDDMPNLRLRNPTAYILGYLASNGGTKMTTDTVGKVFKNVLPKIDESYGVTEPDVIRYARYWMLHLA